MTLQMLTLVLDGVAAHHMNLDGPSLEAMIVQSADAISAARPGGRRDILESDVKRLEKVDVIADSFKEVSTSFAPQAGREIRSHRERARLFRPDTVTVSREIRAVEIAH